MYQAPQFQGAMSDRILFKRERHLEDGLTRL